MHLQTELQPLSYSLRFLQWSALDLTAKAVPPPPSVSPDALAGLFYTSGSTGVPKGVETSHANVHNLLHWWIRLVSLSPADKVLQFSSYSFIMSLRQIFPTLCAGATLVLPLASVDFGSAISTCGVTKAALTPSALATIDPQAATSLRVVQVAGEAPTLALAKAWAARLDAFYIGLGPTELTAHACNGRFLPDEGVVTIGHPVSNAAVYITNEEGCVQPAGVVGELWIAGANVAQGYLNQPELTADRFITNPFDSKKPRLYRTGDFARRLSDGRVQFVGRRDAQVKIRGFRVEMREIVDAVLEGCATLQRAEVSLVDDRLVAFIAPDTGLGPDDLDQLRQFCHRRLPAYMVPSQFVPLPAFPLNKNGKLDREALLVSARNAAAGGGAGLRMGAAPSSPMQLQVCRAWAKVLQKSEAEFTCESSFFDMGGTR